jgi:hypothetical protein
MMYPYRDLRYLTRKDARRIFVCSLKGYRKWQTVCQEDPKSAVITNGHAGQG